MVNTISKQGLQKDLSIVRTSLNNPSHVDKEAADKNHNLCGSSSTLSKGSILRKGLSAASPHTDSVIPFDNISIQPDHATLKGARTFIFCHYSKDELTNRMLWKKPDFTDAHLDILIDQYKEWVKQPIYLIFRDIETGEVIYRRGVKRGNSVYRYHLNRAVEEKTQFMKADGFAEHYLLHGSRGQEETRTLFMTLTWNPDIFMGSKLKAWLSVPYFFNKFMARFRKKYGKTWVMKSLESTKQGYPHIHLLLINETPFKAFRLNDKVRIRSKNAISKMWHSFTDIQVPKDMHELKRYLFKDILKQYNNATKTDLDYMSLTLNWIFQRQSYSISGWDGKPDLIMESVTQTITEEFYQEHQHRDLEFLGLVHLQFPRIDKPPSEFTQSLSEEQFRELEQCMFKRPENENKSIHVVKTCSCGSVVDLKHWDFKRKCCLECTSPAHLISFPSAKEHARSKFIMSRIQPDHTQERENMCSFRK